MGLTKSGCACGETPEHTAAMNRSISAYIWGNVPTHEIENNIVWLDIQRRNISNQIDTLKRIKKDRERAQKWRDDMNAIARQFFDNDALHLDIDTRAKIVKQRLGCDEKQAYDIAELVNAWAKRQHRKNRNEDICILYRSGQSAAKIAVKYGISRQQVHNIVKKDEKTRFITS
ncbi:MAG: hypothetical protein ACPGRX_04735 [Bdellovibrionales bacterium]